MSSKLSTNGTTVDFIRIKTDRRGEDEVAHIQINNKEQV